MRTRRSIFRASPFAAAFAAGGLLSGAPVVAAADASAIGSGAEWHNVNGDSNETGYSRLDQITAANARRLGLAWYLDLPGEASLEASPIEVNGLLYFTGSYATVYAVDAASGKVVWKYEPKTWEHNPTKMNYGFGANRGAAVANGKIFSAALDGRLFALDAKTGRMIWSTETTDPKGGQTVTGAPRVFNGKVIIGQAGADFGMRGYVTAYDQESGKQVWRFYVVPASPEANKGDPAMEAAAKTWKGEFWKKTGGGGGPWDSISFDAELNRIYVGTANASPYDAEARSPGGGDNLYTASIVALDADTGKYVWHYQINPRDSWDYDCTQQMTLATLTIEGKHRKVLMQAPKNGFFYVLDRQTGKLISADKLGKVTWADHIDLATGRPVENPNIRYETGQSIIYPFNSGLHSWMRMAYSPATGLVYVPTMQMATRFRRGEPEDIDFNVLGLNVASVGSDPGDGKGSADRLGSGGAKGALARAARCAVERWRGFHGRQRGVPGCGGRLVLSLRCPHRHSAVAPECRHGHHRLANDVFGGWQAVRCGSGRLWRVGSGIERHHECGMEVHRPASAVDLRARRQGGTAAFRAADD